jgi:hypothetical protein
LFSGKCKKLFTRPQDQSCGEIRAGEWVEVEGKNVIFSISSKSGTAKIKTIRIYKNILKKSRLVYLDFGLLQVQSLSQTTRHAVQKKQKLPPTEMDCRGKSSSFP